jgi:hypothetical protein
MEKPVLAPEVLFIQKLDEGDGNADGSIQASRSERNSPMSQSLRVL